MEKFKKTNFRSAIKKNVEKQKAAEGNYGYLRLPKDVKLYKEEEGKAYLDFMPYIVGIDNHPDKDGDVAAKGTLWYRMPFKVHRNIGIGNGQRGDSVVCPTTFGKKCPICEQRAKYLLQGDKKMADDLKPSNRSLYVVIPLKDKTQKEEPHIWDVSDFLFQKLLNEELGDNEDYAAFPGLKDGLTLRIRFEGKTFEKRPYAQASRIDFLKREKAYDESILDKIPELEKVLIVLSYKELENKFYDIGSEDIENEGIEDVEPVVDFAPKRKKKVVTKSAIENNNDDDEDDDDDNDDDDEKVKSTKKRKVKEVVDFTDDDDDDDDNDDNDDNEEEDNEDNEDNEEEEDEKDEEEEDNEVTPIRRKKVVEPAKPVRSRKVIEPAEDDDDDDEDEIDIPLKDRCIACGGTGYNSKGGVCKACMGSGRKPKAEAVTSKAMQEEVKVSKPTIEKAEKRKPRKDSCPFDHTFGECDKHDDCLKCPSDIWDKCMDAAEEAE